jgi:hypothetical protein
MNAVSIQRASAEIYTGKRKKYIQQQVYYLQFTYIILKNYIERVHNCETYSASSNISFVHENKSNGIIYSTILLIFSFLDL